MRAFSESLAARHSAGFSRHAAASAIQIEKADGLRFEITIPDQVLEWFAEAYAGGTVVWKDWCDYYPIANETRRELSAAMRSDLKAFIASLVSGTFRVQNGHLYWRPGGAWSPFGIGAAT